ncbi:DUF6338 family protein [Aeromicrobium sp. CF3.5]|uniref:DUF6338 family protein n=1 Tax=Aeromicrobium sp. CF3.5 TaxID=3373078 RepID=UPI003EE5B6EA
MLPTAAVPVLLLIGLVPGYFYLLWTRGVRDSSANASPLTSLLEVLGIGIATTGVVIAAASYFRSTEVANLASRIGRGIWDPQLVRDLSASTSLVIAGSVVLAGLLAFGTRLVRPKQYYPRIWQEVLAERKREHTFVRVDLTDGTSFAGALHGSDFSLDEGNRDIVLRSPITRIDATGTPEKSLLQRVVISEVRIELLSVSYAKRPSPTRRWPRLRL